MVLAKRTTSFLRGLNRCWELLFVIFFTSRLIDSIALSSFVDDRCRCASIPHKEVHSLQTQKRYIPLQNRLRCHQNNTEHPGTSIIVSATKALQFSCAASSKTSQIIKTLVLSKTLRSPSRQDHQVPAASGFRALSFTKIPLYNQKPTIITMQQFRVFNVL